MFGVTIYWVKIRHPWGKCHSQLQFGSGICTAIGSLNQVGDPVPTAVNFVLPFQANLFVLLSIICVLLNVAGLVLGCQSIQFVSSILGCDVVSRHTDLQLFLHSMPRKLDVLGSQNGLM